MRRGVLLLLLLVACAVRAEPKAVVLDMRVSALSQLIQLVYSDVLTTPYVIDPAILEDKRVVSVRFDSGRGDFRAWWREFLANFGYAVVARGGVDFIEVDHAGAPSDVFVYAPKYRDVGYLLGLITPLMGNNTVKAASASELGTPKASPLPSAFGDKSADVLVYQGSKADIAKLQKLLPQLDTPEGEVTISAVVYEVSTSQQDGSAVSLALNLLGGKFGVQLGGQTTGDTLTIKTGTLDAAVSLLSGDTRFTVLSSPHVRVRSGAQGRLVVGQDVPTLGAVSYAQNGGAPVQSVEYRASGVILDLRPLVRGDRIEVNVSQQISDFGLTQTGVNGSPTLTKRELSTTVSLADGELVVLAGLAQDKGSHSDSGQSWMPRLLHSRSKTDSRTEVLLLMQVKRLRK